MKCGRDSVVDPQNPDSCKPAAVADTGGDVFFSPDPAQSKVARIGTPAVSGLTYEWSPKEGLSDPHVAQPILTAPENTTLYTLTVFSPKCNTKAVDYMRAVMLKEGLLKPTDMTVTIDGKTYHTGYRPGFFEKYRQRYLHFPKDGLKSNGAPLPDEFSLRPAGFHVNRQPRGSCWAEGGRSAGEMTYNYILGKHIHVSAQDIINCSGFGSAAGGGQISVDRFLPPYGMVDILTSPYDGYDHKCTTKNGPFIKDSTAKRTFVLRGQDGGSFTWADFKRAMYEFGSAEICGSAGSLGSGEKWDPNPGNGGTNHCYAADGWGKGELHGYPAGDYLRLMNSWGEDWGIDGEGFYRISPDGIKIRSSVMTEHKFVDLGSPCPLPEVDGGPDRTIKLIPGNPNAVRIGTPAVAGQSYDWTPIDSLDNSHIAQPVAFPTRTTEYEVKATRPATAQCPAVSASAKVTVHVYRDVDGLAVEVVQ